MCDPAREAACSFQALGVRKGIKVGMPVITVEIPYTEFIARFGLRHSDHPRDWDDGGLRLFL